MTWLRQNLCAAHFTSPASGRLLPLLAWPLAMLLLLSGCTTIDEREGPIPGLENMTVEEHYVDGSEIYQQCSRCGNLGFVVPLACTCVNFRTRHSVIWLTHDASQSTIEHERAHARGYDHPTGELRTQYAAWVRRVNAKAAVSAAISQRPQSDYRKVSVIHAAANIE